MKQACNPYRMFPALLMALVLSACGGGGSSDPVADAPPQAEAPLQETKDNGGLPDDKDSGEEIAGTPGTPGQPPVPPPPPPPVTPTNAFFTATAGEPSWFTHWPRRLAASLIGVTGTDNEYTGSNQRLRWQGVDGATKYESHANCGGFVTRSMKKGLGWTDDDFRTWFGGTGPDSAEYHDHIVAQRQGKFSRILRVTDIRAGDVIAAKYLDAGSSSGSGHTMFAAGTPVARTATAPIVAGTTQYELYVADSTGSPHGNTSAMDTRIDANGNEKKGAGFGKIRLYAAADGTIAGYTWSLRNVTYFTATSPADDRRSLVVGRVVP